MLTSTSIGRLFSHKSDVWAYGVTLWEFFVYGFEKPYGKVDLQTVKDLVIRGRRLMQPATCSPDLYTQLLKCKSRIQMFNFNLNKHLIMVAIWNVFFLRVIIPSRPIFLIFSFFSISHLLLKKTLISQLEGICCLLQNFWELYSELSFAVFVTIFAKISNWFKKFKYCIILELSQIFDRCKFSCFHPLFGYNVKFFALILTKSMPKINFAMFCAKNQKKFVNFLYMNSLFCTHATFNFLAYDETFQLRMQPELLQYVELRGIVRNFEVLVKD